MQPPAPAPATRRALQSNRLRQRYLAAVLRQDVGFFDTQATTGGLLQGLNEDSLVRRAAWWPQSGVHVCRHPAAPP